MSIASECICSTSESSASITYTTLSDAKEDPLLCPHILLFLLVSGASFAVGVLSTLLVRLVLFVRRLVSDRSRERQLRLLLRPHLALDAAYSSSSSSSRALSRLTSSSPLLSLSPQPNQLVCNQFRKGSARPLERAHRARRLPIATPAESLATRGAARGARCCDRMRAPPEYAAAPEGRLSDGRSGARGGEWSADRPAGVAASERAQAVAGDYAGLLRTSRGQHALCMLRDFPTRCLKVDWLMM